MTIRRALRIPESKNEGKKQLWTLDEDRAVILFVSKPGSQPSGLPTVLSARRHVSGGLMTELVHDGNAVISLTSGRVTDITCFSDISWSKFGVLLRNESTCDLGCIIWWWISQSHSGYMSSAQRSALTVRV